MHNKKHPLGCSLGYIFKFSVLNGKLLPVTIFTGARALNSSELWNDSMNFSLFSKVDICVDFQGSAYILPFYTQHNDDIVQAFSFNSINATDNKCRIITGKLKFAGRYITQIGIAMSYDLNPFQQLGADTITVTQIIGYK